MSVSLTSDAILAQKKGLAKRSLTVDDNGSQVEEHTRDLAQLFFGRPPTIVNIVPRG